MSYYLCLSSNFIDCAGFKKSLPIRGAASTFDCATADTPFMYAGLLNVPVILGKNNGGGVIGFLRAKVSTNCTEAADEIVLLDEQKMLTAGLKLSPQSIKLLKSARTQGSIFTTSNNRRGFKSKSEDVIKCIAMGYIELTESRDLISALCRGDYTLQAFISDKRNGLKEVYQKVLEYLARADRGNWVVRNMGDNLVSSLTRTAKKVNEDCGTKWRKASKSSYWPWTLDHHWFNSQESAISMTYHSLASLLPKDSYSRSSHADKLAASYPTFKDIRTLENCRKRLEEFYSATKRILDHSSNNAYSEFVSNMNSLPWPTTQHSSRYGQGSVICGPDKFPVLACLALGVIPTFDKHDGHLLKFVDVIGALHDNPTEVYYEVTADTITQKLPVVTLLLAYSAGVLNLESLEMFLGPIAVNIEALKKNPSKVHLRLSNKVVCCLAATCSKEMSIKHIKSNNLMHSTTVPQVEEVYEDA